MTKGDFQSQVYTAQAPAAEGDFASKNPRHSFLAGPGGLIAGLTGAIVGRWGWAIAPLDGDGSPALVNTFGSGLPSGFVHREQQALIVTYLASSGLLVQSGFPLTLEISADLWVKNSGTTEAVPGQKCYANNGDGTSRFAATGDTTTGATSTASTIAAKTATMTASIADNILTVTAASGDPIVPGAINATGTNVLAGSAIVSQLLPLLTGEAAGGIGRYYLNYGEQTIASESMTFTYGLFTVIGTVAGTYQVGQTLTGGGTSAGTVITGLGTGTGGLGTYYVNNTQTVGAGAINALASTETKYYARSSGLPGELVKISPTTTA